MPATRKYGRAIAAPMRIGNQRFAQGEVNHAKRQKPKKFTKAEKQALQILIRNKRKR